MQTPLRKGSSRLLPFFQKKKKKQRTIWEQLKKRKFQTAEQTRIAIVVCSLFYDGVRELVQYLFKEAARKHELKKKKKKKKKRSLGKKGGVGRNETK